ncbi:hypothetical protein [Sphingomonas sp. GB1N7]|uniref:hypothetical protein n=1 Tax=Parasphingomonas caseinilytica TaxID=3096158 RepID=UPI002FC5DE46
MNMHYPNQPGHRGIDTSIEAAALIAPAAGKLQRMVLDAIAGAGVSGRTTDEVAGFLGLNRTSVQPRTSELRRKGLIRDSGLRRPNASGVRAIVWSATRGKAHG